MNNFSNAHEEAIKAVVLAFDQMRQSSIPYEKDTDKATRIINAIYEADLKIVWRAGAYKRKEQGK